jgi:hypothetical protein
MPHILICFPSRVPSLADCADIVSVFPLLMSDTSLTLDSFPDAAIEVDCPACNRRGRYGKVRLVERFGTDVRLPDLLVQLSPAYPARARGGTVRSKACGAVFPALRVAEAASRQ